MPGLNINISANVQNAVQGLNTVQQQLAKTATASTAMGGSMANGVKGINQASFALMNLGRVAQDAPFGFIGISNNISPLLESFQRLKAEAGTTGGALKALGASLIGGGGLGLAVSVATGLFTVFAQHGLFNASKGLDETAKSAQKAKEAISGIEESMAKEVLSIRELVATATDENVSREARLQSVKKLREEYPQYLKNLSDEQILSGQVGDAIEKINKALVLKVAYQAAEQKVLPLIQKQLDIRLQDYKLQQQITEGQKINKEDADKAARSGIIAGQQLLNAGTLATKTLEGNKKAYAELQKQIDILFSGFKDFIDGTADLDVKLDPKKAKDKIDQVAETLRKLKIDIDEVNKNPLISLDEKDLKTFDLIQSAINRLRDLKVSDKNPILVKLRAEFDEAASRVALDKFRERLRKTGVDSVVQIPVEISTTLRKNSGLADIVTKNLADLSKLKLPASLAAKVSRSLFDPEKFKDATERAKNYIKDMTSFVKSTIDPIFSAIFDNIGKGARTALQAVGEAIKGVIVQLIRAAAEAAVLSLIVNMISGKGALSFTNAFHAVSGIPKFANGGIAYGPTVGLFGEYNNASTNPEVVAPLDKLKSLLGTNEGTGGNGGVMTAEIRGSNIYLSNERTKTSRRRLYGK